MTHSALHARTQLETGLANGLKLGYTPQTQLPARDDARQAAVLVLFGALDSVAAQSSNTAECKVAPELDVLLTRRAGSMRNHAGEIAFPGGGVEAGDPDFAATALREAHEETGLDPSGVDVLGLLPEVHIPVSNYRVNTVVGWWRLPSEVQADFNESVEVFRVPVAELLDPAARGTSLLVRGSHRFKGPAFQLGSQFGGHVVWGFTAMTLASIFDSLGWAQPWNHDRIFNITR